MDTTPGDGLRERRVKLGLTQADLAEKAGIGRDALSRAEKGSGVSAVSVAKVERALEELETGRTSTVVPLGHNMVEIEVTGSFGIRILARGPVEEIAQLEHSIDRLLGRVKD